MLEKVDYNVHNSLDALDIVVKVHVRCCEYFNAPLLKVLDRDRHLNLRDARAYIWYILHYDYGLSVSTIAKYYGRKRRNIFYSLSSLDYIVTHQKKYAKIYNEIVDKLF